MPVVVLLSHRGNLDGPDPASENAPAHIDRAINAGFKVEVDLRVVERRGGKRLMFGHDGPQYEIDEEWIRVRRDDLLIHLKDFDALKYVARWHLPWHVICHSADPYTITSRGWPWLHDLALQPSPDTIVPLITLEQLRSYPHLRAVGGVCTDFPREAWAAFRSLR